MCGCERRVRACPWVGRAKVHVRKQVTMPCRGGRAPGSVGIRLFIGGGGGRVCMHMRVQI